MTILRCFDLANSSHINLFVMLGFYNIFIKSDKLTIIYYLQRYASMSPGFTPVYICE